MPATFSSFSSRNSFISTRRQVDVCKICCLSASFIVPPSRSLVETEIIWHKSFIQAVKLNTLSFETGVFINAFVYIFFSEQKFCVPATVGRSPSTNRVRCSFPVEKRYLSVELCTNCLVFVTTGIVERPFPGLFSRKQ